MVLPGAMEVVPPDENTLLLLHGEDLTDGSIYGHTVTNNGVSVSTAQSKFGGSSLYFNGSSYLSITNSAFTEVTKDDFTIDWWQYKTVAKGTLMAFNVLNAEGYSQILAQHSDGTKLFGSYTGSTWDAVNGATAFSITTNVWQHWAIVKSGTTLTTYLNGVKYWSGTVSGSFSGGTGEVLIGCHAASSNRDYMTGYIDEFRASNVARWTENFTPPTEPYDPGGGSSSGGNGGDEAGNFEFNYSGNYTDNRINGKGTVRLNTSGTLTVLSGKATVSVHILAGGGGAVAYAGFYGTGGGGGNQTVTVELKPGTYDIVIGTGGNAILTGGVAGAGGNTTAFGFTSTGGTGGDARTDIWTGGKGGSPNGGDGVGVFYAYNQQGGSPNGGGTTGTSDAQPGGDGYVELTFI